MKVFNFFISNFKNENFQFFISNFRGIFQTITVPFGGMAKKKQISIKISKSIFVYFFPFRTGDMAKFFKIQKQKKIQFKFQNKMFSNFPCGTNVFFLGVRLPNLLKDFKNYLFTLNKKIAIYCIPPPWWYGPP
jgi:hypothetical protein